MGWRSRRMLLRELNRGFGDRIVVPGMRWGVAGRYGLGFLV